MNYLKRIHHILKRSKFIDSTSRFLTFARNDLAGWPKLLTDQELIKYKKVLVLTPHPDDESFGMGGMIIKLKSLGCNVQIVWFTNGDHSVRKKEASNILSRLGIIQPDQVSFPLTSKHVLVSQARNIAEQKITSFEPDLICTTSMFDSHIDHQRMILGIKEAVISTNTSADILQYEVWSALVSNVLVDISNVIDEKIELMEIYKSQISDPDINYVNRIVSLNRYRGMSVPCSFAESFCLTNANSFIRMLS